MLQGWAEQFLSLKKNLKKITCLRLEAIFECSEINYLLMRYLFIILFSQALWPQLKKSAEADIYSLEQFQQRVLQDNDTVYVVNFWATWCGPCVKELPHFKALSKAMKASLSSLL